MSKLIWSPQQEDALRECKRWLRNPTGPQVFYLAGYAGTGKTTLAKHLVESESRGRWLFAAYTGKASYVLRQKGCPDATTIHSLIYRPAGETRKSEILTIEMRILELNCTKAERELTEVEQNKLKFLLSTLVDLTRDNKPKFSVWLYSPLGDHSVAGIVIDEVSMVDQHLGKDLESFGKKILVLGDPAQLPPVGAGGYYTKRKPNVMLTEVHRHARNSGILRLATTIREGGSLDEFESCADVEIITDKDEDALPSVVMGANQVLVGMNVTRRAANRRYRELLGKTDPGPMTGDRLVCLRNEHDLGLFNGSQWTVEKAEADLDSLTTWMQLRSEDDTSRTEVTSWMHHMLGKSDELGSMRFGRRDMSEFDWSYALTVHKAQGSQWNHVVLFDQSQSFRSNARQWLYTGITRAAERLTVVL